MFKQSERANNFIRNKMNCNKSQSASASKKEARKLSEFLRDLKNEITCNILVSKITGTVNKIMVKRYILIPRTFFSLSLALVFYYG